jgi:hypothetical protein
MNIDEDGPPPLIPLLGNFPITCYHLGYELTSRHLTERQPAHGLRRNPPVRIDEWPDPDSSVSSNDNDIDIDNESTGSDRDPEFVERAEPLGLRPEDEPELDDDDMWALLEMHLGDLADEEWIDMCKCFL